MTDNLNEKQERALSLIMILVLLAYFAVFAIVNFAGFAYFCNADMYDKAVHKEPLHTARDAARACRRGICAENS